eukprot:c24708_g1_i1 orf=107-1651(+)
MASPSVRSFSGIRSRAMEFCKHFTKWDALVVAIVTFHVLMMPYTKVEESFNIQAMHDLLYHRHYLNKYDHFQFPGVVPRTFIGSIIVSLVSAPLVLLISFLGLPKLYALVVVRLMLGSILLATLFVLRSQIMMKFGHQISTAFTLIAAVQFHLLYYITRPLPNIFALALVNLAYAQWISGQPKATLSYLVFTTVVFRCDAMLLLGAVGLGFLLTRKVTIWSSIKWCVTAALFSMVLTMIVDSIMWQRFSWPEMEVFWFNSVRNRSAEWGVSPAHWYFTSALPRAMLGSYPLCLVGLILDRRIGEYIIPVFAFVLLYSKLPHKELRFILFAIPMLNVSAAVAVARIYNNRWKMLWALPYIGCIFLFLASIAFTIIASAASYANYPGGHALHILHQKGYNVKNNTLCAVHIGVLPAMTGISRFCEEGLPWIYSKEENLSVEDLGSQNFTYLISGQSTVLGFNCVFSVEKFSRTAFQVSFPPVKLITEPSVFIHGNKGSTLIDWSKWPGCSVQNEMG